MGSDSKLARLLEHPAIWRGRSAAALPVLPSGFAALDAQLPGKGWPRTGLIEILPGRFGSGELDLLLPALWVNSWLGNAFVWRGNEMRAVDGSGGTETVAHFRQIRAHGGSRCRVAQKLQHFP